MIEKEKDISSPEYWASVYNGDRKDQKTDASNFKRPANSFDRFQWLADQVEGPFVLDIGSGHATTMKRLKAMHPSWNIVCSDQTEEARTAAKWEGVYSIFSAYKIPAYANPPDSITATQCLEYMEHPEKILEYCIDFGVRYFICTVPEGIMSKWSQLREYTEENFKEWISQYGEIVHFDKVPGLMLCKLKIR